MEEKDPIARHRKLQTPSVETRILFLRLGKPGSHAGVGHVGFNCNPRSSDGFGGVGQPESNRSRSDTGRLRRDFVLNYDRG